MRGRVYSKRDYLTPHLTFSYVQVLENGERYDFLEGMADVLNSLQLV